MPFFLLYPPPATLALEPFIHTSQCRLSSSYSSKNFLSERLLVGFTGALEIALGSFPPPLRLDSSTAPAPP
ncbi:unnamed protein product [Prunus armeniaca]|uniref:Uncharacterized protein n=1 Tax=Prunus armeniaca TaxID=36596 RepID=A0A6J5X8H0_PRUAR|nr:unnamed protein product [Prunus armeniaca]